MRRALKGETVSFERTGKFNDLRQHVLNLVSPNPDATLKEEVIALLRHWLIDHVLKEDMSMKPFLSKHSPDFGK